MTIYVVRGAVGRLVEGLGNRHCPDAEPRAQGRLFLLFFLCKRPKQQWDRMSINGFFYEHNSIGRARIYTGVTRYQTKSIGRSRCGRWEFIGQQKKKKTNRERKIKVRD